ncbi:MAG: type II toxin-antitoxin system VapC family toxin [Planctomycetes bacterium]|nr:type II toxin-antitoxin system VapC family toxin [Planctomycetota bacterium]
MLYMLDTDSVIFMVRGSKATARHGARRDKALALVERCRRQQTEGDVISLSAITVSELEFGARKSTKYEDEIAAVRKALRPFVILDYDGVSCPDHYGRIRHELERDGETIGAMDLLIAAHALAVAATLVTNNLAHFRRVSGLSVASWAQ